MIRLLFVTALVVAFKFSFCQKVIYTTTLDDTSKVMKSFDYLNKTVFEDTITKEYWYSYKYTLVPDSADWIVYFDSNKSKIVAEQIYNNNKQFRTQYFQNGKKQFEIVHDLPYDYFHFTHKAWYPDGRLKFERRYTKNNDTITTLYYYPNGNLFKLERTIGQTPSYIYTEMWCKNGQLIYKGPFVYFGQLNDITHYHCNGKIKVQFHIFSGTATGIWQEWYENGQIKMNGEYKDVSKETSGTIPPSTAIGKWSYWDENGKLIKEIFYEEGEIVKETKY